MAPDRDKRPQNLGKYLRLTLPRNGFLRVAVAPAKSIYALSGDEWNVNVFNSYFHSLYVVGTLFNDP